MDRQEIRKRVYTLLTTWIGVAIQTLLVFAIWYFYYNSTNVIQKIFVFKVPFLPVAYDGKFVGYGYAKYDYISSFNFYYRMLPVALVEEIRAQGKKVKVWTLDAPADAPSLPVDGVITDRPAMWKKKE